MSAASDVLSLLQPLHEVGCISVAAGRRRVFCPDSTCWVTAQGDDVSDTLVPVVARDFVHIFTGCIDASQVRGRP
jgi:hypothetical protein